MCKDRIIQAKYLFDKIRKHVRVCQYIWYVVLYSGHQSSDYSFESLKNILLHFYRNIGVANNLSSHLISRPKWGIGKLNYWCWENLIERCRQPTFQKKYQSTPNEEHVPRSNESKNWLSCPTKFKGYIPFLLPTSLYSAEEDGCKAPSDKIRVSSKFASYPHVMPDLSSEFRVNGINEFRYSCSRCIFVPWRTTK